MTLLTSHCFENTDPGYLNEFKIWFTVILCTFKSTTTTPPPIPFSSDSLSSKVTIFWSNCFIDIKIISCYITLACPLPLRISKHFTNHIVFIASVLLPTDKYPLLRQMQQHMTMNFRSLFWGPRGISFGRKGRISYATEFEHELEDTGEAGVSYPAFFCHMQCRISSIICHLICRWS